ncbi:MAG: SDR family NAD(P)-dependent oxidoreductase [Deltaproteobacteria bacterium]|nr:SDR family NAD(P)-dependent oxidoreductase [Deltaproteobacteria bacterium]
MNATTRPVAVITGSSAGIGAATAHELARLGFEVVLGARRLDRIQALAGELGGRAQALDVTDAASVQAFAAQVSVAAVLVNNAGLSRGLDPVEKGSEAHWREMLETNVMGLLRVTRALLPALSRAPLAHIVNVGSVAGLEVYAGGGGYTATKHAVRAISQTLRLELVGRPIRVTEIDPGMVETEFSLVRFDGDAARAKKVYEGLKPLGGEDVADCIGWVVTRPAHVNIDQIVVKPIAQASATVAARKQS